MQRRGLRALAVLFMLAVTGFASTGSASAATKLVSFDDLAAGTPVDEQYRASHGVFFLGQADAGFKPVVRAAPGKARSGDRVADLNTCVGGVDACGEFGVNGRARGRLTTSASAISVHVGYLDQAPDPGGTAGLRLRGFDGNGVEVTQAATATVTEGAAFTTKLTITSQSANIAYFEIDAPASEDLSEAVAIDDLEITTPDVAPPADIGLANGAGIVEVLQGTTAEDPIQIARLNGSDGDVDLSVSGLPTGMTATITPDPIPGTGSDATLRLTAGDLAPPTAEYTTITITATPSAGAGSEPRSITKLVRVKENCASVVRAEYIDARTHCFKKENRRYVAINKDVRLNGLVLKPLDGDRVLVVDEENKTITSPKSTFAVAVDSDPDIPFYYGPINWSLAADPSQAPSGSPREVIGFDISGVKMLKGLPVTGISASFTKAGKALVKPTLRLTFWPFGYLGGVTTTTTLTTGNDQAPDFSGMKAKVAKVEAVGITLKDVEFSWTQGGEWAGSAKAVLRFAKDLEINAGFAIKDGAFSKLKGGVGNLNTPVGAGVYLQRIGFEVTKSPMSLQGSLGLSAGPSVAGATALSVDGAFKAVLADPWVIEVNGNVKVGNKFEVGNAFVRYSSTGLFELGGKVNWDFGLIYLNGQVTGWVAGRDAFLIEGGLSGCVRWWGPDPCATARALVSSIGAAGCVEVYGYGAGAGYRWGRGFDAFTGCDLGPWRPVHPAAGASSARAAGGPAVQGTRRITIGEGLPAVAWAVEGENDSPALTLVGPQGQRVSATADQPHTRVGNVVVARGEEDKTTYVYVRNPSAGTWTLTSSGSPVARVRQAVGLPDPSVEASVSGTGRTRTLHWDAQRIPGQKLRFAEIGKDVRHAIVGTKQANGQITFRPAAGPGGPRKIVAIVEQNGRPRAQLDVATFRALAPPKPTKPRRLNVKRRGNTVVVGWTPGTKGFRHAVSATLSDGRRLVKVVAAGRRSVTLHVPRDVAATIRVRGLTGGNAKGPVAVIRTAAR